MVIIFLGALAAMTSGCSHLNQGGLPKVFSGINPAARRDAPTMYASARQQELEGDSESTLQNYRDIVKRFPDHGPSHHRLAVNLDQGGKPEMAAPHYQIAIQLLPNNSELLCDCGYSLYLQGNDEMAARFLNAAIEEDPGNQRAHNNLGMVLARLGNASAAVEQFSRAGCNQRQALANLKILAPHATLQVAPLELAAVEMVQLPKVVPIADLQVAPVEMVQMANVVPVADPVTAPPQTAPAIAKVAPIVREATQPEPLLPIPNAQPISSAKQITEQAMLAMNLDTASDVHLAAFTTQPDDNKTTIQLGDIDVTGPVTFTLNDQSIADFR